MASAKTARSRGAQVKENGVKVEEGLNVFKSDKFDAQSYVQSRCSLNEKVRLLLLFFPTSLLVFFIPSKISVWFLRKLIVGWQMKASSLNVKTLDNWFLIKQ